MTHQELINESQQTIAALHDYFSGNNMLSLSQFEKLLDKGQDLRDQLEHEIFALRDKGGVSHG